MRLFLEWRTFAENLIGACAEETGAGFLFFCSYLCVLIKEIQLLPASVWSRLYYHTVFCLDS